ncbi:hypothetical protein PYK79_10810 [Streptomyces sp. ID05-04B]|uniref:hypothetical protein n=1 Tax=Streptomyces sp. ID05-04B TaxID=3028661 RepID=UPI0029C5D53A|nr:hypothetical protein [Streptomyces sp. ID05-04B]MDX5563743.1 hypothetical protein [Streptomyces sp. ID05-04B]
MERESSEFLITPVSAGVDDPTGYTVQVAVLADGVRPESGDWHDAAWGTDNGQTVAMILVGPDGVIDPGPGTYRAWVRIEAPPEIPVVKSPRFTIS